MTWGPLHTSHEIEQIKDEALGTLEGAVHINNEGMVKVRVCDRIRVNTIIPKINAYREEYKVFFESVRDKKKTNKANSADAKSRAAD